MAFPEKENPAEVSDAGSHTVAGTREASNEASEWNTANEKSAAANRAREEREITEAFQLSHDALEFAQNEAVHKLHIAPQDYELDRNGGYEKARKERIHETEGPIDPQDVIDRYRADMPTGEK